MEIVTIGLCILVFISIAYTIGHKEYNKQCRNSKCNTK